MKLAHTGTHAVLGKLVMLDGLKSEAILLTDNGHTVRVRGLDNETMAALGGKMNLPVCLVGAATWGGNGALSAFVNARVVEWS